MENLGLALKTRNAISIFGELVGQQLDRKFALELGVAGTVQLTHSTLTEQFDDALSQESSKWKLFATAHFAAAKISAMVAQLLAAIDMN